MINLLSKYRYRLRNTYRHWRLALLYARHRLSPDDALSIIWECQHVAGHYPLSILTTSEVMEQALETWKDHPRLLELVDQATDQVFDEWIDNNDTIYHAAGWALDLVREYAKHDGITLTERE